MIIHFTPISNRLSKWGFGPQQVRTNATYQTSVQLYRMPGGFELQRMFSDINVVFLYKNPTWSITGL